MEEMEGMEGMEGVEGMERAVVERSHPADRGKTTGHCALTSKWEDKLRKVEHAVAPLAERVCHEILEREGGGQGVSR